MKKCLVSRIALGLSLVALPFLGGCSEPSAGGSNLFVTSAAAQVITADNPVTETATNAPVTTNTLVAATDLATHLADTNLPLSAVTNAVQTNLVSEAEAADPLPPAEQKPPANLQLSPVLSEAVKLAQSGVDQGVLFTFITNTTGYFSLGADEIVYLNDLGVEGNVITAMMEHDKELRELRATAWQAYAASNQMAQLPQPEESEPSEEMAAAPSYVEPPIAEPEPVYVSNSYFYETLAPYGTWVYVPGYGRCWRPTVAHRNVGWRPYVDRGRWVYSDTGWYWLSDYTWGATTFHYGRWFQDSRWGWCWWPDTVWAPSWVSWRYTSDYCGWAPLPPNCYYQSGFGLVYNSGSVGVSFGFGLGYNSYAFVPWGSFCAPQPYRHCLPPSRAVHVYKDSRPHNHWEGGGKGKAHNRGLAPERVRELSRTEVRTVSVREQSGRTQRAERIERDGRTLTVRRPQYRDASDVATTGGAAGRGSRQTISRGGETTIATTRQPAVTTLNPTPAGSVRMETRQPEQRIGNRPERRVPVTPASDSTVESKPVVTTPTRSESRPDRNEGETVIRPRTTSPIIVRSTPQPATRPTSPPSTPVSETASTENRAAEQPRVVQPNRQSQPSSRPTAPARGNSIIVIGNGNNTRSSGRDYSVWSTSQRPPAPSPVAENPSPRETPSVRNPPPAMVNAPQVTDNSPAPVTRAQNPNWQNRGNSYNRSDNRVNNQPYSAPQNRPATVNVPNSRPTPAPNYNARPSPSAPAQSYVSRPEPAAQRSAAPARNYAPRSQPSVQPSAPRVDSRPTVAPSRASAPAAQPGQSPGRPSR